MDVDPRHKQASTKRNSLINLALLIFTCMFMLLSLEAAFRVRAYQMDKATHKKRDIMLDKFYKWDDATSPPANALGPMIRPSSNDKIAFEMRPDLIGSYAGAEFRTNNVGFRGDSYAFEKPPGTIRIFGIGDSFMFGQGVAQEETYMSVLEKALNNKHNDRNWQTINSGVPDYNTYIELETLADKGLRFSPDVVILGFCKNDHELPALVRYMGMERELEAGKYLRNDISFLAMYIKYRLNPVLPDRPPLKNNHKYRGGFGAITSSVQRLYALQQQHGFDVVVLFIDPQKGDVENWFMDLSRALNFHIVDMEEDIRSYMKHNGISDYYNSEMTVQDKHPSAIVHEMTARRLLEYMERSGLIKGLY
ncbi:SGNH/GDSL hydrolase family protein [Nitrospirota bacterium]